MAFTPDDLTNLNDIIKSGVTRVVFDNKEINYASIDNLLKAQQVVSSGQPVTPDPTTGVTPVRVRQLRVFTSKGL